MNARWQPIRTTLPLQTLSLISPLAEPNLPLLEERAKFLLRIVLYPCSGESCGSFLFFLFFFFFCKSKKKIQDGTRQSRINPTNSCSPSLSLSDDISRIYARVATGLRYESLIYLSFLVEEKYHHYSTEVTLKKCYERLNSGTFQRTRMKFSFRKILVIPPAQSTKLHGNRLIAPFPDLFRGIYIYIYKSRKQEGKQAVFERINYNNTVLT